MGGTIKQGDDNTSLLSKEDRRRDLKRGDKDNEF